MEKGVVPPSGHSLQLFNIQKSSMYCVFTFDVIKYQKYFNSKSYYNIHWNLSKWYHKHLKPGMHSTYAIKNDVIFVII